MLAYNVCARGQNENVDSSGERVKTFDFFLIMLGVFLAFFYNKLLFKYPSGNLFVTRYIF